LLPCEHLLKEAERRRCEHLAMNNIYQDALVEINEREIIFHRYYFPTGSDKRVPLSDIESVEVRQPSTFGGSYRIWGSGDLRTWYPLDRQRPKRDRIFRANLRSQKVRIGFTVERSEEVINVLKQLNLLRA
jgi:hypothetical protein